MNVFLLLSICLQISRWIVETNAKESSRDDLCKTDNVMAMERVNTLMQSLPNITQSITEVNDKFDKMELDIMDQKLNLVEQLRELKYQLKELREQQVATSGDSGEVVIQRRLDGSVDFYRTWNEYRQGFGNTTGEFFIGLEKIHKLTNTRPYQLVIVMEDWDNDRRYAKYDQFIIGSAAEKFNLKSLGTYSGSAGDSLTYNVGQKFSTKDQDNDAFSEHCAVTFAGAWWYKACHHQRLYLQRFVAALHYC